MIYELGRLAWDNLMRARTRLIMTCGGVLIGTAAVTLLLALTFGLQRAAEAGIGASATLTQLYVYPSYAPPSEDGEPQTVPMLDDEAIEAFAQIPGVVAVLPMKIFQGSAELVADDYYSYGSIYGIDPSLLTALGVTAAQGELTLADGQAIFGGAIGNYFYDPNAAEYEPIVIDVYTTPIEMNIYSYDGDSDNLDLSIVAVLQEGTGLYDNVIFMTLNDVLELNEWVTGERIDLDTLIYDQVIVRTDSRENTNAVAEAIAELGFGTSSMGEFLDQLNGFFTAMRVMLGGIGAVALLVAAFGVANTMTMAILERTKEIGLMKAIGARDLDVLTIFLLEAGLVGFGGGAAGVGVSLVLQRIVNQGIQSMNTEGGGGVMYLPFDLSQIGDQLLIIPTELIVFAIVLATLVGLGAGLFPALRAARMPPVIALKQE
jgi:putative ABC transport system permease protein